jgi:DNA replication protein DnaC
MNGTTRQQELEALLNSFHLPAFGRSYQQFARQAEKEKIDHVGYLYQLARLESEERQSRKTERLIRQAKLPRGKHLDDFDLKRFEGISESQVRELAEGSCLDSAENILIFGNPGTGKTHLAAALGRQWCLRGRHTLFTTASALVQELLSAKRDLKLNPLLRRLDRFDALIVDDISYVPHDRDETDVLFVLLSERYEQRSLVITSNLPFSQWDKIFKDTMTTMAAVDRLVHHATVLELNGESYRIQAATRKNKKGGEAKQEVKSN